MKKREKMRRQAEALNDNVLNDISGGQFCCGGPIYKKCTECGKDFKAGNSGVKDPLKVKCDECMAEARL